MSRSDLIFHLVITCFAVSACSATSTQAPAKPVPQQVQSAPFEVPKLRLGGLARPIQYRLELAVDPDDTNYSGQVDIDIELLQASDHIWLHAEMLTIEKIVAISKRDGILPATKHDQSTKDFLAISLGRVLSPGPLKLSLAFRGRIRDTIWRGIFRQRQSQRDKAGPWYVYTQFQATSARKVFPCFDEPQFKVPFQLTIKTPANISAYSNTPLIESVAIGKSRKHIFRQTKPLPSYLIAFAVGDFEVRDLGKVGRNKTPVRLIGPRGSLAGTEFAQEAMKNLQPILEDYFDLPYPYAKLDHILLPQFLGAMENPGLITYAKGIVGTGGHIGASRELAAMVVSHELSHQWFGDLVTLAWWNDTWLNESFASWLAAKAVRSWQPSWPDLEDKSLLKAKMLAADGLPSARAIRQPIRTKSDIAQSFGSQAYWKGLGVLNMFERWLGEDIFRTGVRNYIRKHSGGTATSDDFFAELAAVSDAKLPAALASFINQAGAPIVSIALKCADRPQVDITQQRFAKSQAFALPKTQWQVPVCLRYPQAGKTETQCQLLDQQHKTITLTKAKSCPAWVHGNADDAGFYHVSYADDQITKLLRARGLSRPERIGVAQDLVARVHQGSISLAQMLPHLAYLAKQNDAYLTKSAAGLLTLLDDRVVPEKQQRRFKRFLRKLFGRRARSLGWVAKPKEDRNLQEVRTTIVSLVATSGDDAKLQRQAKRLARQWLRDANNRPHPRDFLPVLRAAAQDPQGAKAFHKLVVTTLQRERLITGPQGERLRPYRSAMLSVLGRFRDPKLQRAGLTQVLSSKPTPRELTLLFRGYYHSDPSTMVAFRYLDKHFDKIMAALPAMVRGYVGSIASYTCNQKDRDTMDNKLRPRVKAFSTGAAVLDEALINADACIARKRKLAPELAALLKKY